MLCLVFLEKRGGKHHALQCISGGGQVPPLPPPGYAPVYTSCNTEASSSPPESAGSRQQAFFRTTNTLCFVDLFKARRTTVFLVPSRFFLLGQEVSRSRAPAFRLQPTRTLAVGAVFSLFIFELAWSHVPTRKSRYRIHLTCGMYGVRYSLPLLYVLLVTGMPQWCHL